VFDPLGLVRMYCSNSISSLSHNIPESYVREVRLELTTWLEDDFMFLKKITKNDYLHGFRFATDFDKPNY
jgi:hypothetical protein